jgi:ADP-heptose:LPS heptosyltransferase
VWRFVSDLRSRRFDVIADFTRIGSRFNAIKRFVLFNLIQGKWIVGRNTKGWGFFLDRKVFDPDEVIKHEVEHLMDIAKLLDAGQPQGLLATTPPELELFLSDDDRNHVKSFFEKNRVSNERPVVGINPNAFWTSKRWMKERFAAVADRLASYHDAQIIFVGSRGDIPLVEKIRSQMKSKSINAAGKTSIRQLGALIEQLDLFITNDSGPMHIAAAAKTSIIALFGPEKPVRYDPYCAENMKVVFWKGVECSPCLKVECSNLKCMKLITVEEVLTGAEKLLSIKET